MDNTTQHLTTVTVQQTAIMYLNKDTKEVFTDCVIGNLSTKDSKEYVKNLNEEFIFIQKDRVKKVFTVDTIQLLQLETILA